MKTPFSEHDESDRAVQNVRPRRLALSSRRLLSWSPEIALALVTTVAGFWAAGRWVDPIGDTGTWWSIVYRLARGELLYRDVYLQFGPLSPYLLSWGARLFGASVAFMLLACWIPAILAALLLISASRRLLTITERLAAAGLLLAVAVFAPGPARLVFPYAPAAVHALAASAAALCLVASERPRLSTRAWLAGTLAGIALLAKQEIGVACVAALLMAGLGGLGRKWVFRCLAGFSSVVFVGTLFVLSSAPLRSLREQSRVWPLAVSPPATWQTLYTTVAGLAAPDWFVVVRASLWQLGWYVALFALFSLLLSREKTVRQWIPATLLLVVVIVGCIVEGFSPGDRFFPVSLSMLVGFAVAVAGLAGRRLPHRPTLIACGMFAGLTATRAGFSTDLTGPYVGVARFASSLTWVMLLCIVLPTMLLRSEPARLWSRRIAAAALLAVGVVGTGKGIESLAGPGKQAVETRQGTVFVPREAAAFFRAIPRSLSPGEKVWVLPEINGVDALFRAQSVSPYSSHMPGWLDERDEVELLRRIEREWPNVVVIFSRETREYGLAPFGEGYDRRLAGWISRHYGPVETTSAGTILRRE